MNQPTHNFIIDYYDMLVKLKRLKTLVKVAKNKKPTVGFEPTTTGLQNDKAKNLNFCRQNAY